MSTLGLSNFGNLAAPIEPLQVFDDILGDQSTATKGAGCIGFGPAVPYAAGSIGAAIQASPAPSGGTTANRPAVPKLYQFYVDTTLGQPIWCTQVSPAIWINAAGVAV